MDNRLYLLQQWLSEDLELELQKISPASADASFRRYFRIITDDSVFVAMDAPPEKESVQKFITSALALADIGVHVPHIYAQDIKQGFLLLEDLGTRVYLDSLKQDADHLYQDAMQALITLQNGAQHSEFMPPLYDASKLDEEMELFKDWFLAHHLNRQMNPEQQTVWVQIKRFLSNACLEQPQVWVHRDYHSRNLMITDNHSPGVIDFQDIVLGPIAYDLASLFKDCYIEWPRAQQLAWLEQYRQQAELKISAAQLLRHFDLVGLQRHLKVLGIFCRLNYRDSKPQYLSDLPLVAKYVLEVIDLYPELSEFKALFSDSIAQVANLTTPRSETAS